MPSDFLLQHFTRTFQYCDFVVKFRDVLRPTAARAEKTQFAQSNVHFQNQVTSILVSAHFFLVFLFEVIMNYNDP